MLRVGLDAVGGCSGGLDLRQHRRFVRRGGAPARIIERNLRLGVVHGRRGREDRLTAQPGIDVGVGNGLLVGQAVRVIALCGQFVPLIGRRHGRGQRGAVEPITRQWRQRRRLAAAHQRPAPDHQQQRDQAQPVPATAGAVARTGRLLQTLLRGGQVGVPHLDQRGLLRLELFQLGHALTQFLDLGIARGNVFLGLSQLFVSQHVALGAGSGAGGCACGGACGGNGRRDFKASALGGGRGRGGGCRRCGDATVGRLRDRCTRLPPLRGVLAHDRRSLLCIDLRHPVGARRAQHRALLEQVHVATDEGIGIGPQQRDHRLVAVDALLAGQRAGDLREGLPTLHRDAAISGDRRSGCSTWRGRARRGGRLRTTRRRGGNRCGLRCGLTDDGVGHRAGRGDDLRLGHGGGAVGRVHQGGILTDQAALPPVGFDQEIQRGRGDRCLAAHAHHGAALRIAGQLELQLADQPGRRLQPDPGKRRRRGQRDAEVFQLGRIGGNDGDFGQQRLARLGQHPDIAQAEGHGRTAGQGQQQRRYILERTHCARSPVLHGGQYNGSPRDRRCFNAGCRRHPHAADSHAISLRRRPARPAARH